MGTTRINLLKTPLAISVTLCKNGDMLVKLARLDVEHEIQASPADLAKMCFMILEEVQKVNLCLHSPVLGHA